MRAFLIQVWLKLTAAAFNQTSTFLKCFKLPISKTIPWKLKDFLLKYFTSDFLKSLNYYRFSRFYLCQHKQSLNELKNILSISSRLDIYFQDISFELFNIITRNSANNKIYRKYNKIDNFAIKLINSSWTRFPLAKISTIIVWFTISIIIFNCNQVC